MLWTAGAAGGEILLVSAWAQVPVSISQLEQRLLCSGQDLPSLWRLCGPGWGHAAWRRRLAWFLLAHCRASATILNVLTSHIWSPRARGAVRAGHKLNPISCSPCGAVPLAGVSPHPSLPHARLGQVDPFIPVYWN